MTSTSHYRSAALAFRQADDNVPVCYAWVPQNRPSTLHSYVLDGQVTIDAIFDSGRGECERPITAQYRIPVKQEANGSKALDFEAAQLNVTREEPDIYGGKPLPAPVQLDPAMVHGLVASVDDHVHSPVSPDDPSPTVAAVDTATFRDELFGMAIKISDLRNGDHARLAMHGPQPPSVVPVTIKVPVISI